VSQKLAFHSMSLHLSLGNWPSSLSAPCPPAFYRHL